MNYRPFYFWRRLLGYDIINDGHESVVGLLSSFYVLFNIWPTEKQSDDMKCDFNIHR